MAQSSKKNLAPAAGAGNIRAVMGVGLMVGVTLATNGPVLAGGLAALGVHPALAATLAVLAWALPMLAGAALMAPLAERLVRRA
jgi:hypothetical protein